MTMAGMALALAAPVAAQVPDPVVVTAQHGQAQDPKRARAQLEEVRYQVRTFEGILVNAVRRGAAVFATSLQPTADQLQTQHLFNGMPEARGLPIPGVGLFFDVTVPAISEARLMVEQLGAPSIAPDPAGTDPNRRRAGATATAVPTDDPMKRPPVPVLGGPRISEYSGNYFNAVRDALVDAMLEFSRQLRLPAAESLRVWAREAEPALLANLSSNIADTMLLEVSGADLAEYHAGRIGRPEIERKIRFFVF